MFNFKKTSFLGTKSVLYHSDFKNLISLSTYKMILRRHNLKSYVASKKPLLKPSHMLRRKKFSKELHKWLQEDTKQIVFSVESWFEMFPKTKIREKRLQNLKLHPNKISNNYIKLYVCLAKVIQLSTNTWKFCQ